MTATFVLVHGAYHGARCWRGVAGRLRARGHAVHTPTLTEVRERSHLIGCDPSLETFIEDVAQVIRYEDLREVVLVGYSFASSVVSALADRMPERLRFLVYLDALLLRPGESSAMRSPERSRGLSPLGDGDERRRDDPARGARALRRARSRLRRPGSARG